MVTATATTIAHQITTIAGIISAVESAKRDGSGERWWMPLQKKVSDENNFGLIVGSLDSYSKSI